MLARGDLVTVDIEKPAVGGPMIGRIEGQVVLVEGAIPGERVRARITQTAPRVAHAVVEAVETPSPDRRPAVDPRCGGCLYAHIAHGRQLAIKADVIADALARLGKLDAPGPIAIAPSPETGYRMRARLHGRGPHLGFFREGTHEPCEARTTGQLLPATADLIDRLAAGLRSLGVADAREVEISENRDASERAVHVELGGSPARLSALARTGGLTGLSASTDAASGVTVLGGSPFVTDRLDAGAGAFTLRRHVLAFFQGNRYLLETLVRHVAALVPAGARTVDLYAGGGAFAIAAATKGARVTAVEGDPVAAADLEANAVQAGGSVETLAAPVEEFLASGTAGPEVVIVDPPRTGMSKKAIARVMALRAPALIYVSCDVATLARDARRLVDAGYRIVRLDGFDLFPNTPHVEAVTLFER